MAAELLRKSRRALLTAREDMLMGFFMVISSGLRLGRRFGGPARRGRLDRRTHPGIGAAATDIAAHGGVGLRIGRRLGAAQQWRWRHHPPALAGSALPDVLR